MIYKLTEYLDVATPSLFKPKTSLNRYTASLNRYTISLKPLKKQNL